LSFTTTLPSSKKFDDPHITLDGTPRAKVTLQSLKTLWINTGTQCNLSCENCYIESNPKNDRLSYFSPDDLHSLLTEIQTQQLPTEEIAFTGGEPFLNPHIIKLLELCLTQGFKVLVLTNAYRVIERHKSSLLLLQQKYPNQLLIRVSLDHYTLAVHEKERGDGTFLSTLETMKWFSDHHFQLAVAGRSLTQESKEVENAGYRELFSLHQINVDINSPKHFTIFPEMDEKKPVPEITEKCFSLLKLDPHSLMCASSRMVVKRKGESTIKVLACTLLAYDPQFELGTSLKNAKQTVFLNHPHCAKFCVLGGATCSQ
jgi:sulfatase maturation enzyme AslB (radical SAM superfamily)